MSDFPTCVIRLANISHAHHLSTPCNALGPSYSLQHTRCDSFHFFIPSNGTS